MKKKSKTLQVLVWNQDQRPRPEARQRQKTKKTKKQRRRRQKTCKNTKINAYRWETVHKPKPYYRLRYVYLGIVSSTCINYSLRYCMHYSYSRMHVTSAICRVVVRSTGITYYTIYELRAKRFGGSRRKCLFSWKSVILLLWNHCDLIIIWNLAA